MKNFISKSLLGLCLINSFIPAAKAEESSSHFSDYLGGCIIAMGAGVAGTAFANSKIETGSKINTTGYAISGGISCLAGMGYVAIVGSQSEFNATWKLKKENENLAFQRIRLSKERCLIKKTCAPGGNAVIVESDSEIKKQGDKVFETSTYTIEANE